MNGAEGGISRALSSGVDRSIRSSLSAKRDRTAEGSALGAIAEFERDLIRERVVAGVRRARALGKHLGRPRVHQVDVARAVALRAEGRSWRATARALGVHPMAVRRAIESLSKTPTAAA
jgi:DNA invertase Pin-like site-specific DNA recombinase